MNYQVHLDSYGWRTTRKRVLRRDNYRCADCGRPHELNIHHLNYDRLGRERLEDLTTLCKRCHRDAHYYADCVEPTEKMLAKQRWVTEEEYSEQKAASKEAE